MLALAIGMLVIAAGCVSRETAAVIADIKETRAAFDCRLAAEEIADELDASPVRSKESQADYRRRLAPCQSLDIPPAPILRSSSSLSNRPSHLPLPRHCRARRTIIENRRPVGCRGRDLQLRIGADSSRRA